MWRVGRRVGFGTGKVGCGPIPAFSGTVAVSPQLVRLSVNMVINSGTVIVLNIICILSGSECGAQRLLTGDFARDAA
jgi:hypothetical protein